ALLRPRAAGASISSGESIVEADAKLAAKRRVTEGILILLVEKIGHADIAAQAAAEIVAGGEIESRVAGIPGETGAEAHPVLPEAEEVAIRSRAGEISREIGVHPAKSGVQDE